MRKKTLEERGKNSLSCQKKHGEGRPDRVQQRRGLQHRGGGEQ